MVRAVEVGCGENRELSRGLHHKEECMHRKMHTFILINYLILECIDLLFSVGTSTEPQHGYDIHLLNPDYS